MEFRQFRYILKIDEEGTLSLAAKKLYISQPSLSQLLAAQEKKIGAPHADRRRQALSRDGALHHRARRGVSSAGG